MGICCKNLAWSLKFPHSNIKSHLRSWIYRYVQPTVLKIIYSFGHVAVNEYIVSRMKKHTQILTAMSIAYRNNKFGLAPAFALFVLYRSWMCKVLQSVSCTFYLCRLNIWKKCVFMLESPYKFLKNHSS